MVKNPPAMQEAHVPSLAREDPLEKEMATHSSILAWKSMDRGAWRAPVHGVPKDMTESITKTYSLYRNVYSNYGPFCG